MRAFVPSLTVADVLKSGSHLLSRAVQPRMRPADSSAPVKSDAARMHPVLHVSQPGRAHEGAGGEKAARGRARKAFN
jgi:hypothetical protein